MDGAHSAHPDNPNLFLQLPTSPRTCRTARRCVAVLLAILCVLSTGLAGTSAFIRSILTPELLYSCDAAWEPSSIFLFSDAEDSTIYTLGDVLIASCAELGLALTEEDAAEMLERFSVPAILTVLAQDVLQWFLGNGDVPTLTPERVVEQAIAGMDDGLYQLCAYYGEPETVVLYLIGYPMAALPVESYCAALAPYRFLASEVVMTCAVSCTIVLLMLLFLLGYGMCAARWMCFANCVLALGTAFLLRFAPPRFSAVQDTPFLNAVLARLYGELRTCFLLIAAAFLVVFVGLLLYHMLHTGLCSGKSVGK